jgi:hypothetical protein
MIIKRWFLDYDCYTLESDPSLNLFSAVQKFLLQFRGSVFLKQTPDLDNLEGSFDTRNQKFCQEYLKLIVDSFTKYLNNEIVINDFQEITEFGALAL